MCHVIKKKNQECRFFFLPAMHVKYVKNVNRKKVKNSFAKYAKKNIYENAKDVGLFTKLIEKCKKWNIWGMQNFLENMKKKGKF